VGIVSQSPGCFRSNNAGWIASDDCITRNIRCHYTACCYYGAVSYRYAGEDSRSCTNPHIVADGDMFRTWVRRSICEEFMDTGIQNVGAPSDRTP